MDATELHRDAIVIDATCPLARIHKYVDWYREGGATAIAPTITGAAGSARTGFAQIGGWHRYVRERDDTIIVRQAADIERAKADLVGIDHTGIGIDYYEGQHPIEDDAAARARYENRLATGQWRAEDYPPPPYKFPKGIETPRTLPRLTERLLERGFSEEDIRKIWGGNWIRAYRAVWGG